MGKVIIMLSYESTSFLLTLLWVLNAAGYKKCLVVFFSAQSQLLRGSETSDVSSIHKWWLERGLSTNVVCFQFFLSVERSEFAQKFDSRCVKLGSFESCTNCPFENEYTSFNLWLVVSNMNFISRFIYGMSSFPLTNSYFSRWLKPPTRSDNHRGFGKLMIFTANSRTKLGVFF